MVNDVWSDPVEREARERHNGEEQLAWKTRYDAIRAAWSRTWATGDVRDRDTFEDLMAEALIIDGDPTKAQPLGVINAPPTKLSAKQIGWLYVMTDPRTGKTYGKNRMAEEWVET